MPAAYELVTGRLLNPGAGPAALGANTGQSFQIRSTPDAAPPYLLGMWGQAATAGLLRLRSPRMHDNVQGIRTVLPAATVSNVFTPGAKTLMYSQDQLTFEIGGGGAETDSGSILIYYPDLGGAAGRFTTWGQVRPLIEELVTIRVTVVGPVVAGDWSPGTAINATQDLLKANADYAILGYVTGTACNAVAINGSDTSNYMVGGPGPIDPLETRDYFVMMSEATGYPMIPVINQANRGSTLAHVALNTAAGTVEVDFFAGRLSTRI